MTALRALAPVAAHAHGGDMHQAWSWTWSPTVWIPLLLSLGVFEAGVFRLRGRTTGGAAALSRRAWLFRSGWLLLTLAAVSPLHHGGERSFTLHMIEHEIFMLAAAPLLCLSRPLGVLIWACPTAGRRGLGRLGHSRAISGPWCILTEPVTATLLQAAALWLWHAPALFDLALRSEAWHIVQHLSFIVTALLFWTAMFDRVRVPHGAGLAALCLFVTSLVAGALGALMAFSESPWYARYAALGLTALDLSPSEDQQLAGLLMWIPGGLVHAGAALAIVGKMVFSPKAA